MFVSSNCFSVKHITYEEEVSKNNIFTHWDIWKNQEIAGEGERRDIAVELMKKTFNENIDHLDLRNLNLTSLPNHIGIKLIELKISKNKISELPDIDSSTLEILDASSNKLTELKNRLPENLICLNLRNNLVSSLTYNLPDNLKKLDIAFNKLNIFPNNLPINLNVLDVSYNELTNNIENIPQNLKLFYANDNKLSDIKCELPLSLDVINIRNNNIDTLPSGMYSLRKETSIFLEGNPISKECKNKLNDICSNPDYMGPDFLFDSLPQGPSAR